MPVVLLESACAPVAVFSLPVALLYNAATPLARVDATGCVVYERSGTVRSIFGAGGV